MLQSFTPKEQVGWGIIAIGWTRQQTIGSVPRICKNVQMLPIVSRESSRWKVTARNPANFSDSWVRFLIRDVLVRRWMSAAPLTGFITCGGAITIHKVNRFLFLYTWLILRCSLHGWWAWERRERQQFHYNWQETKDEGNNFPL